MSTLIHWPGASPHPEQFIFLISESHPPPGARELLEQEKAEQRREELNALYVAITRAQERLVLSCSFACIKSATWRQRLQAVARPIEPEPEPASLFRSVFSCSSNSRAPGGGWLSLIRKMNCSGWGLAPS